MSAVLQKHSRMPRKLSRRTLKRREEEAIGGVHSLSEVNPEAIVQRYIAGEKIKDMASQYGVSRIAMYHFLLRHVPEDWMAAQKAKAFAMKEQGEELITDAEDPLELGKGREQLRAGQWDLERVDRKNYGRDETVHVHFDVGSLDARLRRARERLVEAQVIDRQISSPARMNDTRGREISSEPAAQLEHRERTAAAQEGATGVAVAQQSTIAAVLSAHQEDAS
jgi:hypothetical protein